MQDFPLLCRLCGAKTDNGLYIYCDEGKRRQVETKIRLYLHFQVVPSDSLPKKICASCFEELEGMHRFAINTLKVQDHLLKLSKDLPLTAINVCKTFMTGYVPAAEVNEAVASLTDQEVTELEVQVDPMVFLEDDVLDESMQEGLSDSGIPKLEDEQLCQLQNCNEENTLKPLSIVCTKASVEQSDNNADRSQTETMQTYHQVKMTKKVLQQELLTSCDMEESNLKPTEKTEQEPITEIQVQDLQIPELSLQASTANNEKLHIVQPSDTLNEQTRKLAVSYESIVSAPESTVVKNSNPKKTKRAKTIMKSTKKMNLLSTSPESIKCTTYTCPICKKVFMKRGPFKSHLETHKTDHKYACEICLRVFKKDVNLLRHRKSHTELTTFPCAHCNRMYPTMSTLRSHLVSHSDERPHTCTICSKSFKRNQDLKFHLNQHNGLRPYHCPYCTKAFASSGNCFSHRRRAHMQEIEKERALKRNEAPAC